eukprot:gene5786-6025_t
MASRLTADFQAWFQEDLGLPVLVKQAAVLEAAVLMHNGQVAVVQLPQLAALHKSLRSSWAIPALPEQAEALLAATQAAAAAAAAVNVAKSLYKLETSPQRQTSFTFSGENNADAADEETAGTAAKTSVGGAVEPPEQALLNICARLATEVAADLYSHTDSSNNCSNMSSAAGTAMVLPKGLGCSQGLAHRPGRKSLQGKCHQDHSFDFMGMPAGMTAAKAPASTAFGSFSQLTSAMPGHSGQLKPSADAESYEFAMPKLTGPQVIPRGDHTLSSSLSSFCLTDTEDDGWY